MILPPQLPPLNVASAQLLAQQAGKRSPEPHLIARRILLCQACPNFNAARALCNRCGCMVVAKVGKERESCPNQLW